MKTKGDEIRTMTDKELAELLNRVQGDGYLVAAGVRKDSAYVPRNTAWEDWIHSPIVRKEKGNANND